MKCILCRKRKAKRYCPAKNREICPVCCGEKRGVEIDCPIDCEYFVEGQKHQQQKVTMKRIRREGVGTYVKKAELYRKDPGFFAVVEKGISAIFRGNKSIRDNDLVSALEQVKKTMETEKNGIYYEHTGENLFANEISGYLLRSVKNYLQNGGSDIDLEFCTEVVSEYLNEAKFYLDNESSPREYLIHISRYHGDDGKSNEGGDKGIIISS